MCRFSCGLLLFVLLVPTLLRAETPTSESFNGLVTEFLDGYWKANPAGAATSAGVHAYDDQMEDFSPAATEREVARLEKFLGRFEALDAKALTREQQVDRAILSDAIRYMLLELRELKPFERNPQFYVSFLGDAVLGPIKRNYAPADTRFRAVAARLDVVGRVLEQAKHNLSNPPEVYTRKAIELIPGTAEFFEKDVPSFAAEQKVSDGVRAEVEAAGKRAADALREFEKFCRQDLLLRSKGNFILGEELYRKKFRYYLGTDLKPEQVLDAAEKALRETQAEMQRLARQIDPQHPLPEVLANLSKDHPKRQEFLQAFRSSVDEIKKFIASKGFVALPSPDRLEIQPAPPFYAIQGAFCDPPGPYEPDLPSFYYVSLLDKFTDAQAEDLLRDDNFHAIPIVTIHEAYPGHYVQLEVMNRTPSIVRKVFCNGPFVEGWAHYTGQIVFEEDFGDAAMRLFQLKMATRAQLNAILDIKLHMGKITPAEAVEMLIKEGFQERTTAEKKVERASLTSGQLSTYFLGKYEILRLRDDYRRAQGNRFRLREYHDRLLALGAPPVQYARQLLLSSQ